MISILRSFAATMFALCMVAQAASAQAEIVKMDEDGFVSRNAVTVAATSGETWQALIAPGKWWNDRHSWSGSAKSMYISAQAGGCFCELLPEKKGAEKDARRGSVQHMVVLMADPGKVLRMRGGLGPLQGEPVDGVLTITLKPVDGGTRVMWEYVVGGYMRFKVDQIAPAVDQVMAEQLAGLVRYLGPIALTPETERGEKPLDPSAESDTGLSDDSEDIAEEDEAGSRSDSTSEQLDLEIKDVDDVMNALDALGKSRQEEPPVPR